MLDFGVGIEFMIDICCFYWMYEWFMIEWKCCWSKGEIFRVSKLMKIEMMG